MEGNYTGNMAHVGRFVASLMQMDDHSTSH